MLISKHSPPRHHALLASIIFVIALLALTVFLLQRRLPHAHAESITKPAGALKIISAPNPNYRAVKSRKIDTVVIHYISGINVEPKRWDNPKLNMDILKRNHVSAHYLVDRDGRVYQLVPERYVAWHAGGSIMPAPDNRRNVNSFSIGIESIATAKSGFTDAQYESLSQLVKQIEARHPIRNIVGHDQISGTRAVSLGLRKDVKPDPGSKFNWTRFRAMLQE